MADLMVRPTYRDGYGISVAEALHFGCPAIASDVCRRAKGAIIFKNRDFDDLIEKARRVLSKNVSAVTGHSMNRQTSLWGDDG